MPNCRFVVRFLAAAGLSALAFCGALALSLFAMAQQPAPEQQPQPAQSTKSAPSQTGEITEDELKRQLLGKPLYLRGGYLDSSLTFNEHGALIGHSPQGSYTLNAIEINRVRLAKHKLELEGTRYGLRFLGALPSEDPTKAVDRVRITPNKKVVRITIDREVVVSARKAASPRKALFWRRDKQDEGDDYAEILAKGAPPAQPASVPSSAPASQPDEMSEADQAKAEIAAAPPAERPADPGSVTTTLSPAHTASVLREALDRIFAPGIDDRLKASMPAFWRLYYQAAAAGADYRPSDPAVLRQNTVDQKARLITTFEPESNEYAQAHAVAGMALYHGDRRRWQAGRDCGGPPHRLRAGRERGRGHSQSHLRTGHQRRQAGPGAARPGGAVPHLLQANRRPFGLRQARGEHKRAIAARTLLRSTPIRHAAL